MNENALLNLAVDAGEIMLTSGAETRRVEDTMERILSVLPYTAPEAFATATGVFASLQSQTGTTVTKVKRVRNRSIHLEKITLVNKISRQFVAGQITLSQAEEQLEQVRKKQGYSSFVMIAASGLASGAFAAMFQANLWEALHALWIGLILGICVQILKKHQVSGFLVSLCGGLLISALSLAVAHMWPALQYSNIIVGSMMPLVPGVAITNAIRDIMEGDYLSGTARMIEAILTAIAIAAGAGIAIVLFQSIGGISL